MEIQSVDTGPDDDVRTLHARVEHFRRDLLIDALRSAGWSKKEAATRLGLSQRAMSHYVAKYELDRFRELDGSKPPSRTTPP
jgi:transcriptional regulator with GAF, ATPase, and Fis domain